MRAPRQLLAWLWAAIWVRWRLVAVSGRRLLGGRRAAVAGSGYYLSAGEIPVEGVDYELADLPPELTARLDAARIELADHARSAATGRTRRRRARRRRTASLAMAALLTLTVLGAGATALVGGSTGVPAIDRLLGTYEAGREKQGEADVPGRPRQDVQPEPSGTSSSLVTPLDRSRIVTSAYVARDGNLCLAMTPLVPGRRQSGDVACKSPQEIADRLSQQRVFVLATNRYGDQMVVRGLADYRVETLEGRGADSRLSVRLGRDWTPGVGGIDRLRPFVAVGEVSAQPGIRGPSDYAFEGITDAGEAFEAGL